MTSLCEEYEKKCKIFEKFTIDQGSLFLTGLLDIPVHSSKIASLHLLFTLYNEFQNSQVMITCICLL